MGEPTPAGPARDPGGPIRARHNAVSQNTNLTDVLLISHPGALAGKFREKHRPRVAEKTRPAPHATLTDAPRAHTSPWFPTPTTLKTTSGEKIGAQKQIAGPWREPAHISPLIPASCPAPYPDWLRPQGLALITASGGPGRTAPLTQPPVGTGVQQVGRPVFHVTSRHGPEWDQKTSP